MHQCHICASRSHEIYRVDEYMVCETCLTQGRLDELPAFARALKREMNADAEQTGAVSSWWNREIPAGAASEKFAVRARS